MIISILALCGLGCSDKTDDSGAEPALGANWTEYTHPCIGNRTDAMWFDDANTGFVGCGSTTIGYGLTLQQMVVSLGTRLISQQHFR